jgi:hypothetical protein
MPHLFPFSGAPFIPTFCSMNNLLSCTSVELLESEGPTPVSTSAPPPVAHHMTHPEWRLVRLPVLPRCLTPPGSAPDAGQLRVQYIIEFRCLPQRNATKCNRRSSPTQYAQASPELLAASDSLKVIGMRDNIALAVHEHPSKINKMVTTGFYSRARHPVYLGPIQSTFGIAFAIRTLWMLIPAILLSPMYYFDARQEEEYLTAQIQGPIQKVQGEKMKVSTEDSGQPSPFQNNRDMQLCTSRQVLKTTSSRAKYS